MIWPILVLIVFICCLVLRWHARHRIAFAKQFKNDLKSFPLIGQAPMFANVKNDKVRWEIMKVFANEAYKQGGVTCSWILHRLYYLVADPEVAESVMRSCLEKDDTVKLALWYVRASSAVSDVPFWRLRRKILLPYFGQKQLVQNVKVFSKQSMTMVEQLKEASAKGTLSMCEYITRYTLDSASETILGIEAHTQVKPDQQLLDTFVKACCLVSDRMIKPWLHFASVYRLTEGYNQLVANNKILFTFIQNAITEKRNKYTAFINDNNNAKAKVKENHVKSFVERMVESTNYDDNTLREESLALFTAATDTLSLATSFTTALLARHPDVQDKVHEELKQVLGDSKRPVAHEDLTHFKYLDAVVKETLRLYPPLPFLLRAGENDAILPSGQTLPKETGIFVNVYAIHRDPKYWGDDAEQFRPERFYDSPPKHPAAFMAFSTGPRNCAGYRYAMMSMKTALATLVQHYRILPTTEKELGQPLDLKLDIMLRATDEFQVKLEPRT